MLYDFKEGTDNPYVTVAQAVKLGSDNFADEVEAIQYIQEKNIKASLVDKKGTTYYKASALGVYEEQALRSEQLNCSLLFFALKCLPYRISHAILMLYLKEYPYRYT